MDGLRSLRLCSVTATGRQRHELVVAQECTAVRYHGYRSAIPRLLWWFAYLFFFAQTLAQQVDVYSEQNLIYPLDQKMATL